MGESQATLPVRRFAEAGTKRRYGLVLPATSLRMAPSMCLVLLVLLPLLSLAPICAPLPRPTASLSPAPPLLLACRLASALPPLAARGLRLAGRRRSPFPPLPVRRSSSGMLLAPPSRSFSSCRTATTNRVPGDTCLCLLTHTERAADAPRILDPPAVPERCARGSEAVPAACTGPICAETATTQQHDADLASRPSARRRRLSPRRGDRGRPLERVVRGGYVVGCFSARLLRAIFVSACVTRHEVDRSLALHRAVS
jgi:hypothetical protein